MCMDIHTQHSLWKVWTLCFHSKAMILNSKQLQKKQCNVNNCSPRGHGVCCVPGTSFPQQVFLGGKLQCLQRLLLLELHSRTSACLTCIGTHSLEQRSSQLLI